MGGERNDWIWIASDNADTRTFYWQLVRRLNALFQVRSRETLYLLVYVTPLQFLGGATEQGVQGMLRVGWPTDVESFVVRIAGIEEIVHLIPLEPENSWLVNHRIDLERYNMI